MEKCKGVKKESIITVLKKLPPSYPVSLVYLNGIAVQVGTFINMSEDFQTAYFMNGEGFLLLFNTSEINGITFETTETETGTEC